MAGKTILFFFVLCACNVFGMELKQLLIVTRHNIRAPHNEYLTRLTPKKWPKWNAAIGTFTPRGALLEKYMGEYFSSWLKEVRLLPDGCPNEKSVHIYTNSLQRTKDSTQAFVDGAFKDCNITVNYKNVPDTEMDPIFNPITHNDSDAFKQIVTQEMEEKLNKSDLKDAYQLLNEIADIKNSQICKEDGYCDLVEDSNKIVVQSGTEPNVEGPLSIANSLVDSFLMRYYEGYPIDDIAWGLIRSEEQWKTLTKVTVEHQNVRYNLTIASVDVVKPLLEYMKETIASEAKFIFLVGHDSNITPIYKCMEFEPFILPDQSELTPPGSKLLFEKWTDGRDDFLKVELVYLSTSQLRNGEKLSDNNLPKIKTMYLKGCITDNDGLCPWKDFEKILNDLIS